VGCEASLFSPRVGTFTLTLGTYEGALARAVRALKFGGVRRLCQPFGARLALEVARAGWPIDTVCAVPLHPLRHLMRGYNQSALVAEVAAQHLRLPYRPIVRRTRRTRQQARLTAVARQDNVAGAFRCTPLAGEQVLLVDDVRTSGATATECALALFAAGAARVYLATLAAAPPRTC
jgi:ComF family protein